jgi:phosphoribosylaminoimidazolecarboxamide formyltransferase/IMP cyclohydrolase
MKHSLKHGENPHQQGYVIIDEKSDDPLAISKFTTASGAPATSQIEKMGWVCLTDLSRGIEALTRVAAAYEVNTGSVPHIAILMQHGNPCGAATGTTDDVLHHAIDGNYRASFGSFLVTNVPLTRHVALCLRQWMPAHRPFSGIAAPAMDELGAGFFARKNGTCHILVNPALEKLGVNSLEPTEQIRSIRGAKLAQTPNAFIPQFPKDWDEKLVADMCLAWGLCAASDSNCITVVKDRKLVTNAVGQPCRTGACELALLQAQQAERSALLKGAAVVSDSFFAFADGIDMLARKKVRAIFATRGSVNDEAVAEHAKQFDVIFHTVPDTEGRIFAGH